MRKIIENVKPTIITCDTKNCGFEISSDFISHSIKDFINVKCPRCGGILLTEHDYKLHLSMNFIVKIINFLFSWVLLFIPNKILDKKYSLVSVHLHEDIGIKNEDKINDNNN